MDGPIIRNYFQPRLRETGRSTGYFVLEWCKFSVLMSSSHMGGSSDCQQGLSAGLATQIITVADSRAFFSRRLPGDLCRGSKLILENLSTLVIGDYDCIRRQYLDEFRFETLALRYLEDFWIWLLSTLLGDDDRSTAHMRSYWDRSRLSLTGSLHGTDRLSMGRGLVRICDQSSVRSRCDSATFERFCRGAQDDHRPRC